MVLSEVSLLDSSMGNENKLSVALNVELNPPNCGQQDGEYHWLVLSYFSGILSRSQSFLTCYESLIFPSPITTWVPQVHLGSVTNIHFMIDYQARTQDTLQCGKVVIWICCAWQHAPSGYWVTAAASSELNQCILTNLLQSHIFPDLEAALSMWSYGPDLLPTGKAASIPKPWDTYKVERTAVSLLLNAADDMAHAWLLAISTKESDAWLHALPIYSVGLRMGEPSMSHLVFI